MSSTAPSAPATSTMRIPNLYATVRHQEVPKNATLPSDFTPTQTTVICAQGKAAHNHDGNCHYRALIEEKRDLYHDNKSTTTRAQKSAIVIAIVDAIRERHMKATSSVLGAFVKRDMVTGRWVDIGDITAREKAGHSIRDTTPALKRSREAKKKLLKQQKKQQQKQGDGNGKKRSRAEMNAQPIFTPSITVPSISTGFGTVCSAMPLTDLRRSVSYNPEEIELQKKASPCQQQAPVAIEQPKPEAAIIISCPEPITCSLTAFPPTSSTGATMSMEEEEEDDNLSVNLSLEDIEPVADFWSNRHRPSAIECTMEDFESLFA